MNWNKKKAGEDGIMQKSDSNDKQPQLQLQPQLQPQLQLQLQPQPQPQLQLQPQPRSQYQVCRNERDKRKKE